MSVRDPIAFCRSVTNRMYSSWQGILAPGEALSAAYQGWIKAMENCAGDPPARYAYLCIRGAIVRDVRWVKYWSRCDCAGRHGRTARWTMIDWTLPEMKERLTCDPWGKHELARALYRAIEALPETDRDMILRRFWGGESIAESAASTGRTYQMANFIAGRGRARLKAALA